MAVKTDYYSLLDLQRTAQPQDIEAAVRKQIKRWRKQTEVSDMSMQHEAERRMELIQEAKRVLLDPQQKQNYDRDLATGGVEKETPGSESVGGENIDWMDRARKYIERNDYDSATYATRMAMQDGINTSELWHLRSRASMGNGDGMSALYEAKESVALEGDNVGYLMQLASVFENTGDKANAMNTINRCAQIAPHDMGIQYVRASYLIDFEQFDEALATTRMLLGINSSDQDYQSLHVIALCGKGSSCTVDAEFGDWQYIPDEEHWKVFDECCKELENCAVPHDPDLEKFRQEVLKEYRQQARRLPCIGWYPPIRNLVLPFSPNAWIMRVVKAVLILAVVDIFFLFGGAMLIGAGGGGALVGLLFFALAGLYTWGAFKPGWKDRRNWVRRMEQVL